MNGSFWAIFIIALVAGFTIGMVYQSANTTGAAIIGSSSMVKKQFSLNIDPQYLYEINRKTAQIKYEKSSYFLKLLRPIMKDLENSLKRAGYHRVLYADLPVYISSDKKIKIIDGRNLDFTIAENIVAGVFGGEEISVHKMTKNLQTVVSIQGAEITIMLLPKGFNMKNPSTYVGYLPTAPSTVNFQEAKRMMNNIKTTKNSKALSSLFGGCTTGTFCCDTYGFDNCWVI